MKKKVLIIGIFVLILVLAVVVFIVNKDNNIDNSSIKNEVAYTESNSKIDEIYNKYKNDVDSGTEYFMESEYYNEMSEDNQIEEMNNLLKKYEKNKIIKNLNYDKESKLFSFIYNYGEIKGALGGVSLKVWHPMMN